MKSQRSPFDRLRVMLSEVEASIVKSHKRFFVISSARERPQGIPRLRLGMTGVTFYFLIVFLTFDFLFLNLAKAAAADFSLGVYPPLIQIQLDPPASITTPITIHNYAEETVTLTISLKPFTAVASDATAGKEEKGEALYLSGKNPLVFENIKVRDIDNDEAIEKVVIAPRQNKTLNLYIDIPKDESLSDYYFSVVFISENTLKDKLSQSKIHGGIATNVLLSIKGKPPLIGAKPTSIAKIVEFSSPSLLEKGPVPFTIRLKNQSNHFITSSGTISIKNIFGKTIGQVKLSPVNILAGTTRKKEAMWQEHILFGPYNATLTITLSDHGHILIKTVHFLVIPIKAFVGLTIVIFIILLVQKRLKTHREH